jgi:S1-C subfamily serine protease
MITANIIHRVFHIRVGAATGTAFTIEHDDRQYLVTAAHVVSSLKAPYEVELFHQNAWKKLKLELTGIAANADIAVFAPAFQVSPALNMPVGSGGVVYGQDVYFLGFPYGISPDSGAINRAFPFPLVKKACLSAFTKDGDANVILLDGHNNPGFSGGPVVFPQQGQPSSSRLKIMSVISGYRFAEEPAYLGGTETPISVRANTGIIISYDIQHAVDEITRNPNGAQIKKA